MTARSRVRATPLAVVVALAALALPASAVAGTAQVASTTGGRANDHVQYVKYTGGDERNVVTARMTVGPKTLIGTATLTDTAGVTPGPGCVRPNAADLTTVHCTLGDGHDIAPAANAFVVQLGGGDDSFRLLDSLSTNATVDGGPGDDVLRGGDGDGNRASGPLSAPLPTGAILHGGPGNDQLFGGKSEDRFDEGDPGANGSDLLDGGGGSDLVSYKGRRTGVRVDLAQGTGGSHGEHDKLAGIESVLGGRGNDRLIGDAGDNILAGEGGSDVLSGGRGDDDLYALDWIGDSTGSSTRTNDSLSGGPGDDSLTGSNGANRIDPGPGHDAIEGFGGNDRIRARDGSSDLIGCGDGRDRVALDDLDAIVGDCERVARTGLPRAVAVHEPFLNGEGSASPVDLEVNCPSDFDAPRCTFGIELLRGHTLLGSARDGVEVGSADDVFVTLNARGRKLARAAVKHRIRIRVRLTTHLPDSTTRHAEETRVLDATALLGE